MTLKATLQVLSMIAVIVPIAPTVWHIKCNNWPAVCLLVYLYILNLNTFIGATIWSRNLDQGFQGHIYCDIMVHFLCAASLGVVCPIVAILRNLCAIMSKQGPSSTFEENASGKTVLNKKKLFIDLAISLGFPIYSMSVLYIVQPSRYSLSEINGCIYFVSSSWVSLVLLFIWPPIISLIGTGYAIVIIFRYMQRRRDFKDLLHCSGSGLTTTRFARLVIFSSVVIAIMLPITLSVLILNLSNGLKSFVWDEVHIDSMWSKVQYFARTKVYFDRWIFITIAFLSFIFFGTGSDALSMYYHWLEVLGLVPLIHRVYESTSGRNAHKWHRRIKSNLKTEFLKTDNTLYYSKGSPSTFRSSISTYSFTMNETYPQLSPCTSGGATLKSPGDLSIGSFKRHEPQMLMRGLDNDSENHDSEHHESEHHESEHHESEHHESEHHESEHHESEHHESSNNETAGVFRQKQLTIPAKACIKRNVIPSPFVIKSVLQNTTGTAITTSTIMNGNINLSGNSPLAVGLQIPYTELPMNFVTPMRSTFTPEIEHGTWSVYQDNDKDDKDDDDDSFGVFWAHYREEYENELKKHNSDLGLKNEAQDITSENSQAQSNNSSVANNYKGFGSNMELDDLHPDLWHYKMVVTRNK